MKNLVFLGFTCIGLTNAQSVVACAPEIIVAAVSSKPYKQVGRFKNRVIRTKWQDDRLLASVVQLAPCAPAQPIEPSFNFTNKKITVSWKWDSQNEVGKSKNMCSRQIDITLFVPKSDYVVEVAKNTLPLKNCY